MGGFCSATYKRGIEFLLLPTTLLSQVDASIGGKLGIDFEDYKNHIGVFQQPAGTFIYAPFLETLPEGELRSGFAEVIKHCLISDAAMWEKIRKSPLEGQNWSELVRHSVLFKYSVIEEDPREAGLRKILNFGHTVGHAVEGHFLQIGKPMYHGEAVAIGMVAESFIAQKKGLLSASETTQISKYLIDIFGKRGLPEESTSLLERMKQDKKNQGKRILMALPQGIGKAIWDVEVSEGEIVESLDFYRSLQT
jgi:3-dehydroquinate synthase